MNPQGLHLAGSLILTMGQSISFKLGLMFHTQYLKLVLILQSHHYHYSKRPSDCLSLTIPKARAVLRELSLSVAGPKWCYFLPVSPQYAQLLVSLCPQLKTYLFCIVYPPQAVSTD